MDEKNKFLKEFLGYDRYERVVLREPVRHVHENGSVAYYLAPWEVENYHHAGAFLRGMGRDQPDILLGCPHRLDGPAYESLDGGQVWCQEGELHCEGGPAIILPHGSFVSVYSVNLPIAWCGPPVKIWYARGAKIKTVYDDGRVIFHSSRREQVSEK